MDQVDHNGSGYLISAFPWWGIGVVLYPSIHSWIGEELGNTPTISTNVIIPVFGMAAYHYDLEWFSLGGPNSKLYLNGSPVGNVTRNSGSGDVVSDVGNLFTIGNRPQNNSSYFKGWMEISEFGNG